MTGHKKAAYHTPFSCMFVIASEVQAGPRLFAIQTRVHQVMSGPDIWATQLAFGSEHKRATTAISFAGLPPWRTCGGFRPGSWLDDLLAGGKFPYPALRAKSPPHYSMVTMC